MSTRQRIGLLEVCALLLLTLGAVVGGAIALMIGIVVAACSPIWTTKQKAVAVALAATSLLLLLLAGAVIAADQVSAELVLGITALLVVWFVAIRELARGGRPQPEADASA